MLFPATGSYGLVIVVFEVAAIEKKVWNMVEVQQTRDEILYVLAKDIGDTSLHARQDCAYYFYALIEDDIVAWLPSGRQPRIAMDKEATNIEGLVITGQAIAGWWTGSHHRRCLPFSMRLQALTALKQFTRLAWLWRMATRPPSWHLLTEITQPCVHTCDGRFICQLYSLPDLLEETDCKEDTPLTLPFALFVSLSQLIIVI
jgi:hypothetical protein